NPSSGCLFRPDSSPLTKPRRNAASYVALTYYLVAGEELTDFLCRGHGAIRAMHRIFTDRFGMELANRACGRLRGIGPPHEIAIRGDGIVAFEHLHHHRAGNHELHKFAEKRPGAVDRIEGLGLLAGDSNPLLGDDAQPRLLDHGVDDASQIARGGVGLDNRKCTLHRHFYGFPTQAVSDRGAYSGGI